jgi:hypothetical protein
MLSLHLHLAVQKKNESRKHAAKHSDKARK